MPSCPKTVETARIPSVPQMQASGVEEVTEEEAAAIEAQQAGNIDPVRVERVEIEEQIRECTKACWGNLAASYLATVSSPVVMWSIPLDVPGFQQRSSRCLHQRSVCKRVSHTY